MRAVVQRVKQGEIRADGLICGRIDTGLAILAGVAEGDTPEDADWLAARILRLRLLEPNPDAKPLSVTEAGGGLLVASQFTLFASTRKGSRPSYHRAGAPELARPLFEHLVATLRAEAAVQVVSGVFGAHMELDLALDGPVTLLLDSRVRE